jgi:Flp pilus assembly protein TadG
MSEGGATYNSNIIVMTKNRERMAAGRNTYLFTNNRKGQSMVEFALILPLLVLIIAGIFDLGRAFFASITITNAAREGARYGTLNADYITGVCQATKDEAQNSGITLVDSNVSVSCGNTYSCPIAVGTGCPDNNSIIVKVNYDYDEMLLRFFFPSGIHMERQVEMLVP